MAASSRLRARALELEEEEVRAEGRSHALGIGLSGAMLVGAVWAWWVRPEEAAALLVHPFVAWMAVGLLPLLIGIRTGWTARMGALLAWFFAWVGFGDEMPAWAWPASEPEGLVVVSANAAGGSIDALKEAMSGADVVLVQETPNRPAVMDAIDEVWGEGSAVVGLDAAIVAKFDLQELRDEPDHVVARGQGLTWVSLRLPPPTIRYDLYRPEAWSAHSEDLIDRKTRLDEIAQDLEGSLVVGGDFNVAPNPNLFRTSIGLQDAWRWNVARGWPGTGTNDFPWVRVDQIWTKGADPKEIRAVKTTHSDHRFVRMVLAQ